MYRFNGLIAAGVWAVGCAAAAVAGGPPAGAADADSIPELFEEGGDAPMVVRGSSSFDTVRRIRFAAEQFKRLRPGDVFTVTPEVGFALPCVVTEVRTPRPAVRIVTALVEEDEINTLIFVTYEDATAMSLRLPARGLVYRMHFLGDGQYQVWRVDHSRLPAEECFTAALPVADDVPQRIPAPDDDDWTPPGEEGGVADGGGCGGTTPVMDTMVVYTPAARTAIGGHSAMRAEAALAIELTNTSYRNSSNAARARLVYCNEIDYTEAAGMQIDLDRLRNANDGFMDAVHGWRDTLNADLVALYTNTGSGIAYCPPSPNYGSGFSVSNWDLAAASLTHAHETGHNLGCGHDRDNNGPCGGSPNYAVGWRFFGNDGVQYRTVLAYPDGIRITHFSNPNVSFRGTPTGVPIGQSGEAHNSRVIADHDNAVAGFELTRFDIYVDFGWILFEDGTPSWPYNTIPEGVAAIAVPSTGAAENPNLYIKTGSTNWTGVITKAMVFHACNGSVILGN